MGHQSASPQPPSLYPPRPPMQPDQKPSKKRHRVRNTLLTIGGTLVFLTVVVMIAAGVGSSPPSSLPPGSPSAHQSSAAAEATHAARPAARSCTSSNACIASEAEKSVVGMTTEGESVVTRGVCGRSAVKHDPGGNYTVYCDLTFSDGSTATGWVNLLPSQNEVTFEPDGSGK